MREGQREMQALIFPAAHVVTKSKHKSWKSSMAVHKCLLAKHCVPCDWALFEGEIVTCCPVHPLDRRESEAALLTLTSGGHQLAPGLWILSLALVRGGLDAAEQVTEPNDVQLSISL